MLNRISRVDDLPLYLPWLDVLRFLACFLVIIQHSIPNEVGVLGHVGVALFFSISGFLIGRILVGNRSLRTFYARRFLRIYPEYLFTLVLFGLMTLTPWTRHPELARLFWHNIIYYLTFTFRLSPDSAILPLVLVWSLCVEELFYLFLPLIFLLQKTKYIVAALLTAVCVLLIPSLSVMPDGGGTWFIFPINLFGGVLLSISRPMLMRSLWPLSVGLISICVMTANGIFGWFHNFGPISAVFCTAAVWSLATCPIRPPPILEPVRRMGILSYGIYLLHFFCVPVAARVLAFMETSHVLFAIFVVILTTALSAVSAMLLKRYIGDPPLRLRLLFKRQPRLEGGFATIQLSLIPLGVLAAMLSRRLH